MIATDHARPPHDPAATPVSPPTDMPPGLPASATLGRRRLPTGEVLEILTVPVVDGEHPQATATAGTTPIDEVVRQWVSAAQAPVAFVPLYGCQVIWTAGRAGVIGPPERLGELQAAVGEFAAVEADLRAMERRSAAVLDRSEGDVAVSLAIEEHSPDRRAELAERHREAVAVGRRLALLAPVVHAPPLHPPTLASQLGERLRERTRLGERHEFATHRAELAERVAEACGQRALEAAIARRQLGLEWAIVVLLVVQTALLVVELLSQRGTP